MNGNPDPIEDERVVLGTRTYPAAPPRFRTSYQRRANINKSRTRSTRKITRAMPRRRMLLRGGAAALVRPIALPGPVVSDDTDADTGQTHSGTHT